MRRRLALTVIAGALTGALTAALAGCVPADPEPTPTPTSSEQRPSPTPTSDTPDALVVGPGEQPPVAFGGDCEAVLTADEVSAAIGVAFDLREASSSEAVGNVGGLTCSWGTAAGGGFVATVLPRSGIGDLGVPEADRDVYFVQCDGSWACSWESDSSEVWVGGSVYSVPGMSRETLNAWAAQLGALVHERFSDAAWERDTTGWWNRGDCAAAAASIGSAIGETLTGQDAGYVDLPQPAQLIADPASHATNCVLSGASGLFVELHTLAGAAWEFAPFEGEPSVDGVDGVSIRVDPGFQSLDGAAFVVSDGVNFLRAYVMASGGHDLQQVARAVGELAAAGL